MHAEENPGKNSAILQIFNKTKCVNPVSNVADATVCGGAILVIPSLNHGMTMEAVRI
jgi:lipoprotein signal peptidase